MYLYLTSKDMSGFHYNNKGTDFVVTLPSSFFFSRQETWKIGLLDFYIMLQKGVVISKTILNNPIHVCCDVVEPSVFNERQVNLLSMLRLKDCNKNIFEPSHVRYVALAQERLTNLHVYLTDCTGAAVSLPGSVSYCTLHIVNQS